MLEFIIVYVTAGSAKEAEQLAQALVGEKTCGVRESD